MPTNKQENSLCFCDVLVWSLLSAISLFQSLRKSTSSSSSAILDMEKGRQNYTRRTKFYLVPITISLQLAAHVDMATIPGGATTQTITKRRIGPTQSPVVSATLSKRNSEVKATLALRKAVLTGILAFLLFIDWYGKFKHKIICNNTSFLECIMISLVHN